MFSARLLSLQTAVVPLTDLFSASACAARSLKFPHKLSCIPVRHSFYEPSRKGDFKYHEEPKRDIFQRIPHGMSLFKDELKLLKEEIQVKLHRDPKLYQHGDTDVIFRFDKQECLKNWRMGSDKIHKEGNSECQLLINEADRHGVFCGVIEANPSGAGKNRRSGYCGVKSKVLRKSFFREKSYDWEQMTDLELRVRGDGRNYIIGLGITTFVDMNWLDLYAYILNTHGGNYWQVVRIPFSKFFLSSKGRIQDKQYPVPKDFINSISLMCSGHPGPFKLDIDYIGVHCDENIIERFAYELYDIPKEIVSDV